MTKTAIKKALATLDYRTLKPGVVVELLGFKMYWQQLYNAPGCVGYAWNPSYVVKNAYEIPNRPGKFNASFSNKAELVDYMHRKLNVAQAAA